MYTQFRPVSVEVGSGKLRSSVDSTLDHNFRSQPLRQRDAIRCTDHNNLEIPPHLSEQP